MGRPYILRKGVSLLSDLADGVAVAEYDFAVHGGAQGAIGLGVFVPDNAVILGGILDVVTALTGTGALAALHVNAANDVISAIVISGAPWSTIALQDIVPVYTAATAIKTTAVREVTLTVTTADLTAGRFFVILPYIVTA